MEFHHLSPIRLCHQCHIFDKLVHHPSSTHPLSPSSSHCPKASSTKSPPTLTSRPPLPAHEFQRFLNVFLLLSSFPQSATHVDRLPVLHSYHVSPIDFPPLADHANHGLSSQIHLCQSRHSAEPDPNFFCRRSLLLCLRCLFDRMTMFSLMFRGFSVWCLVWSFPL